MAFSMPVIRYPEGVQVGRVRTERRNGKLRYVAFRMDNERMGTFGTFNQAKQALLEEA